MSGWQANLVDDDAQLTAILRNAKSVAVVGAKQDPGAPAHYVPAYLRRQGYRVFPVNPTLEGVSLFDEPVVPTVADLPGPVGVVEIFRRPVFLAGHAAEILALPWRPAVVWFQLGIRHDGAARMLAEAGLRVVQDRCMMPDHRRLLGGR